MAKEVYITGHGKWDPDYTGPGVYKWPGFATVPAKCKVVFYVHNMKTMQPSDVRGILKGTLSPEPESEFEASSSYPNMRLSPLSSKDREGDLQAFQIGASPGKFFVSPPERMSLDALIASVRKSLGEGEDYVFHWLCCRSISNVLKPSAEGGAAGVNAREYLDDENRYWLYDRSGRTKKLIGKTN